MIIDDTQINSKQVVPITEILRLCEVCAFNHANAIGLDHTSMEKISNAFWVVSKIKVILAGDIRSGDKVSVKTWTHEPGLIRADRDITIKVGNSVRVKSASEWCALDMSNHSIRRLKSINYPDLEMVEKGAVKAEFSNLRLPVEKKDYVYTRTIRATDIDVNMHTNNLKYNFIALDAFNLDELNAMQIKEWEIYFVNESHEKDQIDVYRIKQKNVYYIEGKVQDKTIFRVVIKYKKVGN